MPKSQCVWGCRVLSKRVRIKELECRTAGYTLFLLKMIETLHFTRHSTDYWPGMCAWVHTCARHSTSTCVLKLIVPFHCSLSSSQARKSQCYRWGNQDKNQGDSVNKWYSRDLKLCSPTRFSPREPFPQSILHITAAWSLHRNCCAAQTLPNPELKRASYGLHGW